MTFLREIRETFRRGFIPRRRPALGLLGIALIVILLVALRSVRAQPGARDLSLKRVRQAHQLVVGLDPSYPPFEVVNGKGQLDGFDVELARELGRRLDVDVRFVAVDFGGIYDALEAHQFDVVIGGITPAPEYLKILDFSRPYYDDGLVLVLNRQAKSHDIGIESGSDADLALDQLTPGLTRYRIQHFDDQDQIRARLSEGQVRGTIVDAATGAAWARQIPNVVVQPTRLTSNPYVIAARRDDASLLRAIDGALAQLDRSGDVARLEAKWLK